MSNIDRVLDRLDKVKKSGKGWMACCPAHDDRSPSMAVTELDGKIVFNCFSGCTFSEIVGALGMEEKDMFPAQISSIVNTSKPYFSKYQLSDIEAKIWIAAQGHADLALGRLTQDEISLWQKTIKYLSGIQRDLLKAGHLDLLRRIKVAVTYKTREL